MWEVGDKLLQKNNSTWSAQVSFNLNNSLFSKDKKADTKPAGEQIVAPIMQSPYNYNPALLMGTYADFSMPWNVSLSYTLSYVSRYVAAQYNFKHDVIQTLSVSGNVNLTPNWRIAVSTGYDFVNKGMSYTSIDIYRDLHCWEMRFNWVPFGYYKSWSKRHHQEGIDEYSILRTTISFRGIAEDIGSGKEDQGNSIPG